MTSDTPTPIAVPAIPEPALAAVPPPPAHPSAREIRRRPPPPGPWREFLAWPGSASLTTLLSAACLLAGAWGVLADTLGEPSRIGDRWAILATLAGYLACLLGGTWAMCRARAGHPDAVASAVVGAVLAVGCGVVLDLVAPDAPLPAALAALATLAALAGLWRGWDRISGGAPSPLARILGLLALWALAWPAVLGWRTATAVAPAGAGTDAIIMPWWFAGWALLLAPLLLAWWQAQRGSDPWAGQGRPYLGRPAMRWVLLLVVAVAAVAALAVQAHVAGLDLAWTDLAPQAAVLLAAANELRARAVGNRGGRDALAVAALPWLAACAALGDALPPLSSVRGEGWAPATVELIGASPMLALFAAALALGAWWRRRSPGLLAGIGLAACAGVVLWDPRHPHLAEVLAVAGLQVAVAAAWHRRFELAMNAATLACASLGAGDLVRGFAPGAPRPLLATIAGGWCLLAWAGWRPELAQRSLVQLTAWLLGFMAAGATAWLLSGDGAWGREAWGALAFAVATAVLIAWCGWRRRDASIVLALAPGGLVAAWPALVWLLPRNRAWLGVWAAFGLLAGAVALAVRRVRRT